MNKQTEALMRSLEALDHSMLFTSLMPGFDGRVIENAYKAIREALAAQPAQQDIDWKDQYEKQKRRAEMWIAKYEADIGQLEKAGPVAEQPAQRCPLCNYQHGHAIGCKNNPVDIALNKMAQNAKELGLDYESAQPEPVCGWKREDDDHMPGTWRSDCGVMWTFTDGSPVDNEMKYCCGCGAMLLEKNT